MIFVASSRLMSSSAHEGMRRTVYATFALSKAGGSNLQYPMEEVVSLFMFTLVAEAA